MVSRSAVSRYISVLPDLAMPLLNEGQTIRGTYEVERLLGEGAFAEVYRVKHRFLGRQAMKVFRSVGMTTDEIEAMLGEALQKLFAGVGRAPDAAQLLLI